MFQVIPKPSILLKVLRILVFQLMKVPKLNLAFMMAWDMVRAADDATEEIEFFNKTGKGSKGVAVATRRRNRNGRTVIVKTR